LEEALSSLFALAPCPDFLPILSGAVVDAQVLVATLGQQCPPFQVVPLRDGGVQLEAHWQGRCVEMATWGNGDYSLLLCPEDANDATWQEFSDIGLDQAVERIRSFSK
jgi:hypothetical protein